MAHDQQSLFQISSIVYHGTFIISDFQRLDVCIPCNLLEILYYKRLGYISVFGGV